MATTYIEGIEIGDRAVETALSRSIDYITDPEKTDGGQLVSGINCDALSAAGEFFAYQKEVENATGRSVKNSRGKTSYCAMMMRQSFLPGEVTPEKAHQIGLELAEKFLGGKYQCVVATHVNTHCIHNHFIFNIIGEDQKKYHQTKYTPFRLAEVSDKICREHFLYVIKNPGKERNSIAFHAGRSEKAYRDTLRADIDLAVVQSKSWEDFLALMSADYYISERGNTVSFRHRTNGQQRNIRLTEKLGADYTRDGIERRIDTSLSREADTRPVFHPGETYSAKLHNIKTMLASMDAMDRFDISSKSEYIEKLSELRIEETRLWQELKEVRIKEQFDLVSDREQEILEKLDDLESARSQLLRLRAAMEKNSGDKGGIER